MGMLLTINYPMQGLFSGNQNIYFLWGMAEMLPNAFAADPLLSSPDPYPLFSWLISIFPVHFLGLCSTVLYVFLSSIYTFSLFGIADRITPIYGNSRQLFSFAALFLFLHSSPVWGTYFQVVFDMDLRWMWDSGIAEQGVLRGYLQPSMFGVFLLLSLYQAIQRKYVLAILSIVAAATIHASYLFLGAMLTVIYLLRSNFGKRSLLAASALLLLVLPYSYYVFSHFIQLDESLKTSINQAVMEGLETNPHINPSNWLNPKFYLQLLIMALGIFAIWRSRLPSICIGILAFGILLTALAYGLDNTTLISLNPWRVSVLIMPIATAAILAKIVSSGMWLAVRPHTLSVIGIIGTFLIVFRLFGNGSIDFLDTWKFLQIVAFLIVLVSAGFIFRNELLAKLLPVAVVIVLVSVGLVDKHVDRISKANMDEFQVISAIGKEEEPNTIYIIPPDWTSFRMNARKAVFVDENLVYGPALPSLMRRLEMVETNNYSEILDSDTLGTTIKLIAPSSLEFPSAISKEDITERYACFTLRQ
ncbi:MAG: hypothetical protein RL266_2437 [Bacteroidota bacterium]